MPNFDLILFFDLMRLDNEFTMSMINPFTGDEDTEEDNVSANLLRLGAGFKMNNLAIQPMITINEDKESKDISKTSK